MWNFLVTNLEEMVEVVKRGNWRSIIMSYIIMLMERLLSHMQKQEQNLS
jgi:hypothetical protein